MSLMRRFVMSLLRRLVWALAAAAPAAAVLVAVPSARVRAVRIGRARPGGAQPALGDQLGAKFQHTLDEIARTADGVVGVSVVDLTSGRRWDVNGATVFPQGSAIKVSLLIELFRGADANELTLTDRVTLTAADRTGGSSLLQILSDGGSALSLHDLAVPMVVLSDNTATNMLIDRVGLDKVNATMATMAPETEVPPEDDPSRRAGERQREHLDAAGGRRSDGTPVAVRTCTAHEGVLRRGDAPARTAEGRRVSRAYSVIGGGGLEAGHARRREHGLGHREARRRPLRRGGDRHLRQREAGEIVRAVSDAVFRHFALSPERRRSARGCRRRSSRSRAAARGADRRSSRSGVSRRCAAPRPD